MLRSMGCEDLNKLVPSRRTSLSEHSEETLAIDSAHWFRRYLYAIRDDLPSGHTISYNNKKYDISQPLALLQSIPVLLRHQITPVFFFDPQRRSPDSKSDTKIPHLENTPEVGSAVEHTAFLQRPTEILLQYLDIDYWEGVRFAEADACVFAKAGLADAVVSNDYDTILYRAPKTLKKTFSRSWEEIDFQLVLDENDIKYRELLDVAALVGTDEVAGPYATHPEEALKIVRQADNLDLFESEHESQLRHPSLDISRPAPSFSQLHDHYADPPTIQFEGFCEPSNPDPDFQAIVGFLEGYLNYSNSKEIVRPIINSFEE